MDKLGAVPSVEADILAALDAAEASVERDRRTAGKLGMTIDEAADCTGIGRNTLRKLVSRGKIPVLRIGRKTIIRVDVISAFMEINQGCDLLDCAQVQQVT